MTVTERRYCCTHSHRGIVPAALHLCWPVIAMALYRVTACGAAPDEILERGKFWQEKIERYSEHESLS